MSHLRVMGGGRMEKGRRGEFRGTGRPHQIELSEGGRLVRPPFSLMGNY